MESLILNTKKVQVDIFNAFSKDRKVIGQYILADITPTEFIWSIGDLTSYKNSFIYRISRQDNLELRSTLLQDYYDYFSQELKKFEEEYARYQEMSLITTLAENRLDVDIPFGSHRLDNINLSIQSNYITIKIAALGQTSLPVDDFFRSVEILKGKYLAKN